MNLTIAAALVRTAGKHPIAASPAPTSECRQRVESTHSLTVRPDIRGCRYANGRKGTRSRLTDLVAPTSAQADDATDMLCARRSVMAFLQDDRYRMSACPKDPLLRLPLPDPSKATSRRLRYPIGCSRCKRVRESGRPRRQPAIPSNRPKNAQLGSRTKQRAFRDCADVIATCLK